MNEAYDGGMAYGISPTMLLVARQEAANRIKRRLMDAGAEVVMVKDQMCGTRTSVAVVVGDKRHAILARDLSDEDVIVAIITDWINGLPRS